MKITISRLKCYVMPSAFDDSSLLVEIVFIQI